MKPTASSPVLRALSAAWATFRRSVALQALVAVLAASGAIYAAVSAKLDAKYQQGQADARAWAARDSIKAVTSLRDSLAKVTDTRIAAAQAKADSTARVARIGRQAAERRWRALRDSLGRLEAVDSLPEGVGPIVATADSVIAACAIEIEALTAARAVADSAKAASDADRDRLRAERDSAVTLKPIVQPEKKRAWWKRGDFWAGAGIAALAAMVRGL